jgi:hypothetical protein
VRPKLISAVQAGSLLYRPDNYLGAEKEQEHATDIFSIAAGCTFCAGTSIFGAFFMFLLGILIKNNYQ